MSKIETRSSFDNPNIPLNAALAELVSNESGSGQLVTATSVLGVPAVYRACKLVAGKVARLPTNVYKRNGGLNLIDFNHPTQWLLQRPNRHYGKFTLISALIHSALLHGNGYALIERNGLGETVALSLLDAEVTFPLLVDGELAYKTEINGQKKILLPEAIIHIRNLSSNGFVGISVIDVLKTSLGLSQSLITYGSVFFKNFSMLGHVIELPGYLDDETVEKFRKGWGDFHKGLNSKEARGLGLLQGGAVLKPVTVNNADCEFLSSREFDLTQIANIFGVPPHKLGSHNRSASYSTLESENQAFLDDGIGDWIAAVCEEFEIKLLTEYQKSTAYSHFIDMDRTFLVRADIVQTAKIDLDELNAGVITLDEYNARKNRSPVGGDIGSYHRMPSNYVFQEVQLAQAQADAEAAAIEPDTVEEADQEDQEPAGTGEGAVPDSYQAGEGELTDTAGIAQNDSERKLKLMIAAEVRRIGTRIDKALATAIRKREEIDLQSHIDVFASALAPVIDNSKSVAALWLQDYVRNQGLTPEVFIQRYYK